MLAADRLAVALTRANVGVRSENAPGRTARSPHLGTGRVVVLPAVALRAGSLIG